MGYAIIFLMSVTQTVDIPASHRLTIDVPREVPEGRAILTFIPVLDQRSANIVAEASPPYAEEDKNSYQWLRGCCENVPGGSVEDFLARCREDKEHELAIEKRQEEERARRANEKLSS